MKTKHSGFLILSLFALTFFVLVAGVNGQGQQPIFKVGDCIEYDTTNAYNPALRWRKGRIVKNDGYFFIIELENRRPEEMETTQVSVASAHKWIRKANGCAEAQANEPAEPEAVKATPPPPQKAQRQPQFRASHFESVKQKK